ncbi:MAG TPA: HAMP domain-containing protein, partial [Candidatus Omnitrophica bacterium]|nr:HAMP domain-containing protein [Candidatus Omnitrophota bacterium]
MKKLFRIASLQKETLIKKLAISFFLMSIIPIVLTLYFLQAVGFESLEAKIPHARTALIFLVLLAAPVFYFMRKNLLSINNLVKEATRIADGSFERKIKWDDGGEIGELAKSFNKITNSLEQKIRELEESRALVQSIFQKVNTAISSSEGIDQLLELVIESSVKGVFAEFGCIMLINPETKKLETKVYYNLSKDIAKGLRINMGEGIVGLSAQEAKIIISSETEAAHPETRKMLGPVVYSTIISVPLIFKDEVLGVMFVANKAKAAAFTEDDKVLLSNIA